MNNTLNKIFYTGIRKFPRKLSSYVVLFNVQCIFFLDMMATSEKLI